MINDIVRRMLRRLSDKTPAPKTWDRNDPNAPWNVGWTRVDVPDTRHRVRFRFDPGGLQIPKAVPPFEVTGAMFASGGVGHHERVDPPQKTIARSAPPRTRLPQTPVADSTSWTRGR